jgi:hypothetical protein
MNKLSKISVLGLLVMILAAPVWSQKEKDQWWQYSYEGDALPSASTPAFELVEPKVKAGMSIMDSLQDGILSMTCIGEGSKHCYQINFAGHVQVWKADTESGSTVEIRARVPKVSSGFEYAAILGTTGYGSDGKGAYTIYFGPKKIAAGLRSYPVDLTEFHVFRYTFDPSAKLFTLYMDGKKLSETPLGSIAPNPYKSNKLLFGVSYSPSMQGVIDIDYLRWTCYKVVAP